MKKRNLIVAVCIIAVLLLIAVAFWLIQSKLDKINKAPEVSDIVAPENEDFETDTGSGSQDMLELNYILAQKTAIGLCHPLRADSKGTTFHPRAADRDLSLLCGLCRRRFL